MHNSFRYIKICVYITLSNSNFIAEEIAPTISVLCRIAYMSSYLCIK